MLELRPVCIDEDDGFVHQASLEYADYLALYRLVDGVYEWVCDFDLANLRENGKAHAPTLPRFEVQL